MHVHIEYIHLLHQNGIAVSVFFYSICFHWLLYCGHLSSAVTVNLHQALVDVLHPTEGMCHHLFSPHSSCFQCFAIINSVRMSFLVFLCIFFHYFRNSADFFMGNLLNYNKSHTLFIWETYSARAHTCTHTFIMLRRHSVWLSSIFFWLEVHTESIEIICFMWLMNRFPNTFLSHWSIEAPLELMLMHCWIWFVNTILV